MYTFGPTKAKRPRAKTTTTAYHAYLMYFRFISAREGGARFVRIGISYPDSFDHPFYHREHKRQEEPDEIKSKSIAGKGHGALHR